jgi:hypothetical protein
MAGVIGSRDTSNVLAAQRVIDMHKSILLLEPDAAPLTVVTKQIYNGARRKAAMDPKFSWLEDELEVRFATVSGAQTSVDTTIETVDGSVVPAESLVKVPRTGEILFVSSVSGNNLTVTRGFAGSTAAALNDQDPLYVLGVADEEGSTSQPARSNNPAQVDGYTQIFKKSVEASESWRSSSNITTVHDWAHQQKKEGIEHLVDIELAFLFGKPSTVAGTDGPRRTTGGILHYATANNTAIGGALTETAWETFMRSLFRYGSKKKVVFAAPLVISALNGFSSSKLQTVVGADTYGVKVMNLVSAHGEVTLIKHNLLQGAVYGGYAVAVDFGAEIAYRFLNGAGPGESRDTKLKTNRQTPDRDGRKDEWISECGLQFPSPDKHGVLTGITG